MDTQLMQIAESPLCLLWRRAIVSLNQSFAELLGEDRRIPCRAHMACFLSSADAVLLRDRITFGDARSPCALGAGSAWGDEGRRHKPLDLVPISRLRSGGGTGDRWQARATDSVDRTLREYPHPRQRAPVGIRFRSTTHGALQPTLRRMFGYRGDEGISKPTRDLYASDAGPCKRSGHNLPLLSKGLPFEAGCACVSGTATNSGRMRSPIWSTTATIAREPSGSFPTSARKKAIRDTLDTTLLDLTAILDNASIGVLFSRNRVIERCNARPPKSLATAPELLIRKPGIVLYTDRRATTESATGRTAAGGGEIVFLPTGRCVAAWRLRLVPRVPAVPVDLPVTDRGTVWIFDDAKATRSASSRPCAELDAIMRNASRRSDYATVGWLLTLQFLRNVRLLGDRHRSISPPALSQRCQYAAVGTSRALLQHRKPLPAGTLDAAPRTVATSGSI